MPPPFPFHSREAAHPSPTDQAHDHRFQLVIGMVRQGRAVRLPISHQLGEEIMPATARRHFQGPPQGIMIRQRRAEIFAEETAVGQISGPMPQ